MLDQEVERLLFPEPAAQALEVAALLHHTANRLRRPLRGLGESLDLFIDLVFRGVYRLPLGNCFQEQGPFDRLLALGPELRDQLAVVPRDLLRIDPLALHLLPGVLDLVGDVPHHHGVRHAELVALEHGPDHFLLEPAPVIHVAARLELLLDLGADGVERVEVAAEGLRELVVEARKDLLLHLDELDVRGAALAAQGLHPVVVGEPEGDVPLLADLHARDRLVDLGKDRPAAHDELVPVGRRRIVPFGRESVVDDDEIAGCRRALDRAELRVLLAHVLERFVHLVVADRGRRVLDVDALVLNERDLGTHLDDRDEAERRAFLERHVFEIRLIDGTQLRLADGLTVDVRDQMLGDFATHFIREVNLHERARNVAFAEARQSRLFLDAAVGFLPFLLNDVARRLDIETALATIHRFDRDLHRHP